MHSFPLYVIIGASPPTNLSAQPTSPTSIRISWTPPASGATVVGYRISYQAEGSQDTHTNPSSVDIGASTTQYILSSLQVYYHHGYQVTVLPEHCGWSCKSHIK